MRVKSMLLTCAGALLLASCCAGEYYEKTPQEVTSALSAAYLPVHVLGGTVADSRVTQPDSNTVVTALIDRNGSEMMRFVTTLTPDGAGTRVATEVRPPKGRNEDRASAAMKANGVVLGLMEKLAEEHVAAAIEGRPFHMTFATSPMAKGMMGAVPGMSEQIDAANEAAAEFSRYEQQAEFESEYGDHWGRSAGDAADGWGE